MDDPNRGNKIVTPSGLGRHAETGCEIAADAAAIFEYIDQPERLSAHMARRSWQLAGSSMTIHTDAAGGRAVGSRIRLAGRMLGIDLHVNGEVRQREPPHRKAWETIGEPRLLVIGRYRMTVSIEPRGDYCYVKIAIDYALPSMRETRWLAMALGRYYASWCVQQMASDLADRFGTYRRITGQRQSAS
jgi:hypothetical protein